MGRCLRSLRYRICFRFCAWCNPDKKVFGPYSTHWILVQTSLECIAAIASKHGGFFLHTQTNSTRHQPTCTWMTVERYQSTVPTGRNEPLGYLARWSRLALIDTQLANVCLDRCRAWFLNMMQTSLDKRLRRDKQDGWLVFVDFCGFWFVDFCWWMISVQNLRGHYLASSFFGFPWGFKVGQVFGQRTTYIFSKHWFVHLRQTSFECMENIVWRNFAN